MIDKKLVQQFQNGKEEAFNDLVKNHQEWVRSFIYKTIQHKEDAEDLAQEVFVKIYFALHKFRMEAEFKTWLYRIILNQLNNYFRKQKILSIFQHDMPYIDPGNEHRESKESRLELIGFTKKLPKQQKNIVVLRSFQDLPFKRIASILEITENSAKVSYHKAIEKMKGFIKGGK